MGFRVRIQTMRDKINAEFNPGLEGDSDKISRLQNSLGNLAFIDDVELTPTYGTPTPLEPQEGACKKEAN